MLNVLKSIAVSALLAFGLIYIFASSLDFQNCVYEYGKANPDAKYFKEGIPVFIRSIPIYRHCVGEYVTSKHDVITAVFTIVIAIFTTVLAIFTISLAGSTRIAANAADMSARAALALELPIIHAEPVGFGFGVSQEGDKPRTEHFGLQCFDFSNLGRTKAFPIEVRWGWTVGDKLPRVPVYKFNKSFDIDVILKPDKRVQLYVTTFDMEIAPGDTERITRSHVKLWLYCSLTYDDFMQTRHEARFCWIRYETFGAGGFRLDATAPAHSKKT